MPRANRYFLSGYVWHITHRCHQRQFLLKFGRDRCRYLHWLFKAKKRFGLCVLDYMVTSNHIHLLVKDTGQDVIAQSMQREKGVGSLFRFASDDHGISLSIQAQGVSL
jgi:putative transposase